MPFQKKNADTEKNVLAIPPLNLGEAYFSLIGDTPLLMHRFADKAQRELLMPRGSKMSPAEKVETLKHDPLAEFRAATYAPKNRNYPTLIIMPSRAFAESMAESALDTPGATKSKIQRLTWVYGVNSANWDVCIYGIPKLCIRMVRMSDPNRTPDMRTRPIFERWACRIKVRFLRPQLTANAIGNLLARSGMFIGIGDDRHERGGYQGSFRIVSDEDKEFQGIVQTGSKVPQVAAMANPEPYDEETAELLSWWKTQMIEREREQKQTPANITPIKNGNGRKRKAA